LGIEPLFDATIEHAVDLGVPQTVPLQPIFALVVVRRPSDSSVEDTEAVQLGDGTLAQFHDSLPHPLVFGNGISQKFEASLLSQFQGPRRDLGGFPLVLLDPGSSASILEFVNGLEEMNFLEVGKILGPDAVMKEPFVD
jgi:hypothetical protein